MRVEISGDVPRRTRHRQRVVACLVALVSLLGVVAACGGAPSYRYVANREHGTFFKVPASWSLENVTAADGQGRPEEIQSGLVSVWHTVFDESAASTATTAAEAAGLPVAVVGSAQIFAISSSYREQLSMSAIRAQAFGGIDPLFAPDDLAGAKVRIVSYVPLQGGDGLNGSRVVANVDVAEDGQDPQWITRDVSMLFDTRKGRIFLLSMACESQCYLQNRADIEGIAGSWTVRQ